MKPVAKGIYPTMITPYTADGGIDHDAVRRLTEWYIQNGCTGVFAVCQSSEMFFLSREERAALAKTVAEQAAGRISVVASGHCGNSVEEQAAEINAVAAAGIDAFVLVSNRLDPHNEGDDVWIANAEKLLAAIDPSLPLGIYECPHPYKRLLTPRILDWCVNSGRFCFIKDTCCEPELLEQRLAQLKDTGVALFNANEQTLLHSLKHGAAGYSGIMGNFHPDLLVRLYSSFEAQPEAAQKLSDLLSMTAFTEALAYPVTAKYYLDTFENVPMGHTSRSRDVRALTPYHKLVLEQLYRVHTVLRAQDL